MKQKRMLSSFLVIAIMFAMNITNVFAQTYKNDDATNESSSYSVNTRYEAVGYQPTIETYDVDLSWDDLHWIFVYEGDIKNPDSSVWLTKENYDSANMTAKQIIEGISNWVNKDKIEISVKNNSGFTINVTANVAQKSTDNYTNSSVLRIARENDSLNYGASASINGLVNGANDKFIVKPTSTRFVNDSGTPTDVTGEVNLVFTKSN